MIDYYDSILESDDIIAQNLYRHKDKDYKVPQTVLMITSAFPRDKSDSQGIIIAQLAETMAFLQQRVIVLAPHIPNIPFQYNYGEIIVYRYPFFFPYSVELLAQSPGMFSNFSHSILAKVQLPLLICAELISSIIVCRREHVTIIHSHWILPHGIIGVITGAMLSIPHICSIHGTDVTITRTYPILSKLIRSVARRCKVITVNSSYTLKILTSCGKNIPTPTIIPMGVEQSLPIDHNENRDKENLQRKPIILFVGRLIKLKGVHVLIKAMKRIIIRYPDTSLVIIGDGVYMNSLHDLVSHLHLESLITFTGRISNQEVMTWYQKASIFVLPSISVDGQTEGLGVVLLEAMAYGVPVIGSNIGGIPDIIKDGENGVLVTPDDPDELSDKIIHLLDDPQLQERISLAGLNTVRQKFNWETIGQKFVLKYNQMGK